MKEKQQITDLLNEWTQLLCQKNFSSLISNAKKRGISISQISTLYKLRHKGKMSVSRLADTLGISNAAASQMLEGLVEKKYITRSGDPSDRRVKIISISPEGREFLHSNMEERDRWLSALSDILSQEESSLILRALEILISKTALTEKDQQIIKHPKTESSCL